MQSTKKVPKRYRKFGRPSWRHDGRQGRPRARGAACHEPAPKVAPIWWCGMVGGRRVTRWDKRRDAVAASLRRYSNDHAVLRSACSMAQEWSWDMPTWVVASDKE